MPQDHNSTSQQSNLLKHYNRYICELITFMHSHCTGTVLFPRPFRSLLLLPVLLLFADRENVHRLAQILLRETLYNIIFHVLKVLFPE